MKCWSFIVCQEDTPLLCQGVSSIHLKPIKREMLGSSHLSCRWAAQQATLFMQNEYERFKLDAAAIQIARSAQQRIIVYNFNLPIEYAQIAAHWETVLQKVETDLPPRAAGTISPPYFQLTAVYTIVHRNTNEERLWLGSFNPRARDLSQVTAFRPVDPSAFVNYCLTNSEPNRVRNKLDGVVNTRNSVWNLGEILSIIASVQSTVQSTHPIFYNHPELFQYGGDRAQHKRSVFRLYFD